MNEVINVRKLSKEFGAKNTKVQAVKDVSMNVSEGEVLMILGPSGSGKTTLLSMIGCILTPTNGEIILDGEKILDLPENELSKIRKKKIGFVFQSFNLLKSLTVQENVEIALNLSGTQGNKAKAKAKDKAQAKADSLQGLSNAKKRRKLMQSAEQVKSCEPLQSRAIACHRVPSFDAALYGMRL